MVDDAVGVQDTGIGSVESAAVSAPGKILLVGGYSILKKGNVGYVVSIDRYSHAKAAKRAATGEARGKSQTPVVNLKSFGLVGEYDADLFGPKAPEFRFANKAIWTFYSIYRELERGVSLETWNDEALGAGANKTGLGSSAASVAAMVGSLYKYHFDAIELNTVHAIAQYVHFSVQGAGSGFDVASTCYGSIKYSRFSPERFKGKSPEWVVGTELDCKIEPMPLPKEYKMLYVPLGKSVSSSERMAKMRIGERDTSELDAANARCIESIYSPADFFANMRESRRLLDAMAASAGFGLLEPGDAALLKKLDGEGLAITPGAGGESLVFLATEDGTLDAAKKIVNGEGLKYVELHEAGGLKAT